MATAATGIWSGSLVDRHSKKTMMQVSAAVSAGLYAAAFAVYQLAPPGSFSDPTSLALWTLIVLLMVGVIAGNIRTIALSTLVTVLISEGTALPSRAIGPLPNVYRDTASGRAPTLCATPPRVPKEASSVAQKLSVQVISDLSGDRDAHTVRFGYERSNYEIDLTEAEHQKLGAFLATYIAAARRAGVSRTGPGNRTTTGRRDNDAVRTWAQDNGFQVSARGRIAAHVQEAYDKRDQ